LGRLTTLLRGDSGLIMDDTEGRLVLDSMTRRKTPMHSIKFVCFSIVAITVFTFAMATTAETLDLNGTVPTETQSRTITVPANGGWVVIAFDSLRTDIHAKDIPTMYSGGNVTQVVGYDEATGTYKTYNPLLPFTDFLLVPGHAYWILVTASGTLTYQP